VTSRGPGTLKKWAPRKIFAIQPPIFLNQANPVSATRYLVLDTTPDVEIIGASVVVSWTTQPTFVFVYFTVDGVEFTFRYQDPAAGTLYYASRWDLAVPQTVQVLELNQARQRNFLFRGHNVKVEAAVMGGVSTSLGCRLWWAKA